MSAIHRLGPVTVLHFRRDYRTPERYAAVLRGRYLEVRAPREILRALDRRARRAAWPLVRRYRNWRADRAWRELRRLDCAGRHPTSVLSDAASEHCRPILERVYWQGWRYYPGDTCEHGTYVGGCGADLLCLECEAGH